MNLRILFAPILGTAAACGSDLPEKPEAPDMSALVQAYAMPTAVLDLPTAEAVADRLRERLDLTDELESLGGFLDEVLDPALEDAGGDEESTARLDAPRRNLTIEGDGFLRIRHICRGFGETEPPVDAAANGQVEAVVGFSEEGLDDVLFGAFERCKTVIGDRDVELDGGINVALGGNDDAARFPQAPLLFQLEAAPVIDGEQAFDFDLSFQACPDEATTCAPGSLEILVEAPADTHLIFLLSGDRMTGGFRAANGEWTCTFGADAATCTQGEDTVVIPGFVP